MTQPGNSRRGGSCRIVVRSRSSSRMGYFAENTGLACRGAAAHAQRSRTPYRGIRRQNQCYLRLPADSGPTEAGLKTGSADAVSRARVGLLPVAFQDLVASYAQPGTILLEAGQNGEIALIDHGAAKTLNVAGTSLLLLRGAAALLLSDGTG